MMVMMMMIMMIRWFKQEVRYKPVLTYFYFSALSFESVRIVNRYEVHKRPKTTVVFETSFLLAKPNGYPTFHGRRFLMGTFL